MKFSSQEEYGLRCLMAIAEVGDDSGMTIPEIAHHEGITEPHAAKLLAILRRANFITSQRGQSGGYRLARPASKIVLGEVLAELGGRLVEEGFCDRHAGVQSECAHLSDCGLSGLWNRIQSAVDQVVFSVTLEELMAGKLEEHVVSLQSAGMRKRAVIGS